MSIQVGKEGSCQHTKQLIAAPGFGFDFVMYAVENKMALYTLFFLGFLHDYFCFPLSLAPHHSSTLVFPSSTFFIIFPSFPAALN